jgi:hypothetical protein
MVIQIPKILKQTTMYKASINRLCNWKQVNITVSIAIISLFFSCAVMAQVNAPAWLNSDIRDMQCPQKTHYKGFAEVPIAKGEDQEKAMARAKQSAISEMSEGIRVIVNSNKTVFSSENDIDKQIISKLSSEVKVASQTELAGSIVDSYYDSKNRTAYAYAHVSKADLNSYYQKQISLWLNNADGALQTARDLSGKGFKMKAQEQCKSVIDALAKVLYAQNLLTATDKHANDSTLQQSRSERIRNTLVQTVTDLGNSISIYVQCSETINGQSVAHIANRLPGIITEKGCGCNYTNLQEEADYVVKIDARLTRCNDAPSNTVFCYAAATISVYNTHTQKTIMPKIAESKGGWTNGDKAKATEEAFKDLAEKIAENVIPTIKN